MEISNLEWEVKSSYEKTRIAGSASILLVNDVPSYVVTNLFRFNRQSISFTRSLGDHNEQKEFQSAKFSWRLAIDLF